MKEVFTRITKIMPVGMWIFMIAACLTGVFLKDAYLIRLLIVSMLYGSLAIAFDFTAGFIGTYNMGLAAFMGVGAYTTGTMMYHLGTSPWMGLIPAILITGFLGMCTGLLTLRLRGIFAAIMTWFLSLGLLATTKAAIGLTRGQAGMIVTGLFEGTDKSPYFFLILIITVVIFCVAYSLTKSDMGMAFKAIGQNIDMAQASGINPTKYKVTNFTISCMMLGVIGWFYAHFTGVLTPSVMAIQLTLQIIAITVIGGAGSLWGGLAIALMLTPVMEYFRSLEEYRLILYGALLVVVIIFIPGGLAFVVTKLRNLVKKKDKEKELSILKQTE